MALSGNRDQHIEGARLAFQYARSYLKKSLAASSAGDCFEAFDNYSAGSGRVGAFDAQAQEILTRYKALRPKVKEGVADAAQTLNALQQEAVQGVWKRCVKKGKKKARGAATASPSRGAKRFVWRDRRDGQKMCWDNNLNRQAAHAKCR